MEGVNPKKKQMCNHASTMCVHTEAKLRSYRHLQLGVSERFSAWLCNLNVFKHTSVYKYWKGVVLKQMASHPPCEFPCTVLSQRDHWQIWTPNIWTLLAKRETPREDEILPLLWLLLLFSGSRGDPEMQDGRRGKPVGGYRHISLFIFLLAMCSPSLGFTLLLIYPTCWSQFPSAPLFPISSLKFLYFHATLFLPIPARLIHLPWYHQRMHKNICGKTISLNLAELPGTRAAPGFQKKQLQSPKLSMLNAAWF